MANYRYAMELGGDTSSQRARSSWRWSSTTPYLCDMQNNVEEAVLVGEAAFNHAINRTHELDEVDHKESTLLLQLLRDNIQLWKHAAAQDHGDEGGTVGWGFQRRPGGCEKRDTRGWVFFRTQAPVGGHAAQCSCAVLVYCPRLDGHHDGLDDARSSARLRVLCGPFARISHTASATTSSRHRATPEKHKICRVPRSTARPPSALAF